MGSARALVGATAAGAVCALAIPLAGMALFAVGNAGFAGRVVVLSVLARTHRQAVSPPDLLPA